jgi:hypothetical protein
MIVLRSFVNSFGIVLYTNDIVLRSLCAISELFGGWLLIVV